MTARSAALRLAAVALVLLVWELVPRALGLPRFVLPGPSHLLHDSPVNLPLLHALTVATTMRALAGMLFGISLGIVTAIVGYFLPGLDELGRLVGVLFRTIPIVALIPPVALLTGSSTATSFVVVTLIAFFPTYVSLRAGFSQASASAHNLFRSLGASATQSMVLLALPTGIPSLLGTLRYTAAATVLATTVAEYLIGERGLGQSLAAGMSFGRTTLVWTASLLISGVATVAYALGSAIDRRVSERFRER